MAHLHVVGAVTEVWQIIWAGFSKATFTGKATQPEYVMWSVSKSLYVMTFGSPPKGYKLSQQSI